MMNEKEAIRISKFLSLVLRHQPQTIGLQLDEQGWTSVEELLQKMERQGVGIDRAMLQSIVDTNNKKRFAFSEDRTKIRASQGHSVPVELDYKKKEPPPVLYHGTADKNQAAILVEGIRKQARHHVHLSADKATGVMVGKWHGRPVVLEVKAEQMHKDGYSFFLSANGVWLTDHVPASYLRPLC